MIAEGITIHSFDSDNWVINTGQGRNLLVNRNVKKLFEILVHSPNEDNARVAFNQEFGIALNGEQFSSLISEKLGGYSILLNDNNIEKPTLKNQYLKLKIQLISPKVAGYLARPFMSFFAPKIFWWSLILCVITIFSIGYLRNTELLLGNVNYTKLLLLVYATMLIHELGHIGACAKYGLKHGGIGFGFYFILPVMYADITNIWLAGKEKRIIANLAGIFTELLYAAVLGIVYLTTNDYTFLVASIAIASFVLWEFNPFVRFDGYWVLSDLTGTPNLLTKANKQFMESMNYSTITAFLKSPIRRLKKSGWREQLLFIYGLLNTFFLIAVMAYTLLMHWTIVKDFPIIILDMIQKVFQGKIPWNVIEKNGVRNLIVVLTFYMLATRWFWTQSKLLFQKINSKNIYFASENSGK